jgi:hypothetical protein
MPTTRAGNANSLRAEIAVKKEAAPTLWRHVTLALAYKRTAQVFTVEERCQAKKCIRTENLSARWRAFSFTPSCEKKCSTPVTLREVHHWQKVNIIIEFVFGEFPHSPRLQMMGD